MGFSRQEYWSELPCPPPGDLPNPGIEPMSLASSSLQAGSLPESLGKPCSNVYPQSFLRKTNRCHNSLKFVSMACHVGLGEILVPRPRMETVHLGAWSLSHPTTREVPAVFSLVAVFSVTTSTYLFNCSNASFPSVMPSMGV